MTRDDAGPGAAVAPPPGRAREPGRAEDGGAAGRGRAFMVELERFQGPLDLLLHLIRSQDIDIFDIPVARITRQFREIVEEGIQRMELDRAGEFLEMAATLVRIKAQLLLPRNQDPDWEEDPRADLVRRLLEYEHFQEVAHILSGAEADRSRHFPKGFVPPRPDPGRPLRDLDLEPGDLLQAAVDVPRPEPEHRHEAPTRDVTVEEKLSLLQRLLARTRRVLLRKLFGPARDRLHAVTALLACLEAAKQQMVHLRQAEPFGDVWIFRSDEFDPGAEAGDDAGHEEGGSEAEMVVGEGAGGDGRGGDQA